MKSMLAIWESARGQAPQPRQKLSVEASRSITHRTRFTCLQPRGTRPRATASPSVTLAPGVGTGTATSYGGAPADGENYGTATDGRPVRIQYLIVFGPFDLRDQRGTMMMMMMNLRKATEKHVLFGPPTLCFLV